jgi:hypothetical protein
MRSNLKGLPRIERAESRDFECPLSFSRETRLDPYTPTDPHSIAPDSPGNKETSNVFQCTQHEFAQRLEGQ